MTFKSYIFKETLELIRTYKIFIILIVALLFAFTAPLITLFLPKILESQVSGNVDLSGLFESNQTAAIQSFLGDMYEILGMIIIVFSTQSIVSEFKSKKIVIPFSIGIDMKSVYMAKYLITILYSNIILTIATLLNFFYSGLVFEEFSASLSMTLIGLLGFLIFLDYCIAVVFCFSTFTKSTFIIVTIGLANYYVVPNILALLKLAKFSPYYLIKGLSLIPWSTYFTNSIIIALSCIIVINTIGMLKIKHFELK